MNSFARLRAQWPVLLAACLGAFATPAAAALRFCNQTSYVLYAATGVQSPSAIVTRGWTRILPGDCASAIDEPLKAPAYFDYARSSNAYSGPQRAWGGQFRLCVKDNNFSLTTPVSATLCKANDAYLVPFAAAGGASSWTTTFTEQPALLSPDMARAAGLRRFLDGLGYSVEPNDTPNNKSRDDALAKFRARMKLPSNTSESDLLAALENAARKTPAPVGYSICNESNTQIWAAIGIKAGSDYISRGWWAIASGKCATAITDFLGRDPIYLFATKHGSEHLVSGPDAFCITSTVFDIYGRSNCAARKLSVAGFLATNLKGSTGFTAHIGNDGLIAPHGATPK